MVTDNFGIYAPYVLLIACIWLVYFTLRVISQKKVMAVLDESLMLGLNQPSNLHPKINASLCIGCKSCVKACPEENVLGVIGGKAKLIRAANCIGHGACQAACPSGAINLVFGTSERGVDLPVISSDFQTNVKGIFIAGELGGMGLVRNAIQQGKQAVESIAKSIDRTLPVELDLVIIGSGPAGISAGLKAKELGLNFLVIEQDSLGGTVAHFPRSKLVMTSPVEVPLVGTVNFKEISKEDLLRFWQDTVRKFRLPIHFSEKMETIESNNDFHEITTSLSKYQARAVLLCLGRRGTPRKLGVRGESLSKVVYRLIDPQQYIRSRVLVVGGGDSAIESAISIADLSDYRVAISYRNESFSRAKPKNRERLKELEAIGKIQILLNSEVEEIEETKVKIRVRGESVELQNDSVIVNVGGEMPTSLLEKVGIQVRTHYGE